jgi:hypothetical protein
VHRALVEQRDDHTGRPAYKLLSQTDVISFLGANKDSQQLAPFFAKPYTAPALKIRIHI